MQLLKQDRVFVWSAAMAATLGLATAALGYEESQSPSPQGAAQAPSSQAPAGAVAAPQAQASYQTVNTVECVTVPVTTMQTQYRTEYRTENVPVTRMVPETVNETRTITRFIPQQETINKQVIANYVCEPVTDDQEVLPTHPGHQERDQDAVPDVLHHRDRDQGNHQLCPRMCHRDRAGDENPQGRHARAHLRHAEGSGHVHGSRHHVCPRLRPQVRRGRLRCLRRSHHVRRLSAGHELCVPAGPRHAAHGEVRARNHLRSAHPDEADARQADGAGPPEAR